MPYALRICLASAAWILSDPGPARSALDPYYPLATAVEFQYGLRYARMSDFFDGEGVKSDPLLRRSRIEHLMVIKASVARYLSLESEVAYMAYQNAEDIQGLDRPSLGIKLSHPSSPIALTADIHFPTGDSLVVGEYPALSHRYGAMLHTPIGTAHLTANASYAFHVAGDEGQWNRSDAHLGILLATAVTPELVAWAGLEHDHFYCLQQSESRWGGTSNSLTRFIAILDVRAGEFAACEFYQDFPFRGRNRERYWTSGIRMKVLVGMATENQEGPHDGRK